ncbi:hypothetical protein V8G54_009764 [Vigna mungo]|uniref:GINS subunit domain-containing protein n=1 Tax=Vigna mungo TaxID=3915 RepID=A0AAQ3NXD1_VIGMU
MSTKDCGHHHSSRRRLIRLVLVGVAAFILLVLFLVFLIWVILRPANPASPSKTPPSSPSTSLPLSPTPSLSPCSDLVQQVVAECSQHLLELQSLIRKMEEERLEIQTVRNADYYGALIHHLTLVRNKRCLMAYVYNRAEIIRNLLWKIGHVLPQEIEEKLSHGEGEYYKKHSAALKYYMSKVMVDLTVVTSPSPSPPL